MRIALVSFEFPPAVALGGIGAYSWHAAHILQEAGHEVSVFAAGTPGQTELTAAVKVTRVASTDRAVFRRIVAEPFMQQHASNAFDVFECPEYGAEGIGIRSAAPEIPMVVRLHTPHFLVQHLNESSPTLLQRLRFSAGALRRGRIAWLKTGAEDGRLDEVEQSHARSADLVVAPCQSLAEIVKRRWLLPNDQCVVSPNFFRPDETLIRIPHAQPGKRVVFVGRLETRKGVWELAAAIPRVWRTHPDAHFTFVGPGMHVSGSQLDSREIIRRQLSRHGSGFALVGERDRAGVYEELGRANVAVFPSRWENFPNACLEAMSAGRAVIGSAAGGMADMIEPEKSGLLVQPRAPCQLAETLSALFDQPDRIPVLGQAAREAVCERFSPSAVLPRHLQTYCRAIERSRNRTGGIPR